MRVSDLKDVLWTWINRATGGTEADPSTGLDASWVQQPAGDIENSAPRPSTYPFATLQIISRQTRGNDADILSPPSGAESEIFRVRRQRELTVSVTVYGEDTEDLLDAIDGYLQRPSVNGSLRRSQEDIISIDDVVDGADYTLRFNGDPVTITAGTPTTAIEIRDALVDAVNSAALGIISEAGVADNLLVLRSLPGDEYLLEIVDKMSFDDRVGAVDLVYLRNNGESDVAALLDGITWENRRVQDFIFGTSTTITDEPGVIDSVEISSNITETFTVGG